MRVQRRGPCRFVLRLGEQSFQMFPFRHPIARLMPCEYLWYATPSYIFDENMTFLFGGDPVLRIELPYQFNRRKIIPAFLFE